MVRESSGKHYKIRVEELNTNEKRREINPARICLDHKR
jgi:hypothetical protein